MEHFSEKTKADKIKIIISLVIISIIIVFLAIYYRDFILQKKTQIDDGNIAENKGILTPEQKKELINLMTASPAATSSLTKKQVDSIAKSMTASPSSKETLLEEEKNKLIDLMTAK